MFGGIGDRKGQCRKCDLDSSDTDLKLQCLQFWAYLYLICWFLGKDAPDRTVVGSVDCEGIGVQRKSTERAGREASCSEAAGSGLYLFICCYLYFPFFCLCCMACEILVPQPEIEPMPPTVEAQSLNHWTTRKSQLLGLLDKNSVSSVFFLDKALFEGWTSPFLFVPPSHVCLVHKCPARPC